MSHQQIANAKGQNLAYFHHKGDPKLPTVMFCGGFKSDMMGSKATYLEECSKARGQSYVRFDYTGHGLSDGEFVDGTIGSWCADALTIIDKVIEGPIILVGSSMGGWISLLCAIKRPDRIAALMGIAAAPDFTGRIYDDLPEEQQQQMNEIGRAEIPNDYSDEPYIFTRALLEDGEANYVFDRDDLVPITCPVYLVQGVLDTEVPWETASFISENVESDNVIVELIKDAAHNVSRPQDLVRLNKAIEYLNEQVAF
ncbi:MAG: alpha/beta hydrolase [Alphaproteobacteria bacterium]|nr:alpha/beta hydrolase [Alphaproteobacteria bacterium]